MCRYVNDREEEHGVGDLSMEPLRLVQWQESCLWSEPPKNVPAHGHDDDHGVD
jgi:hypothetical protein